MATYTIRQYTVNIGVGSIVAYTAGQNDVSNHGLELNKVYAGMVVGYDGTITDINIPDPFQKYKIRLFLDDGNDLTITRSDLHYYTAKMIYGSLSLLPTNDGTFYLVNEAFLFDK